MSKGGSFENEVCEALGMWWCGRDDVFCRTRASGAKYTARKKVGKDTINQGGDITFSDSIGEPLIKKWSIECKTGYGSKIKGGIVRWDILDILDSKQKQTELEKMWQQCKRDAELTERIPILIFRRNRRSKCMMMKENCYQNLCFPSIVIHIKLSLKLEDVIIFQLKDFIKYAKTANFK